MKRPAPDGGRGATPRPAKGDGAVKPGTPHRLDAADFQRLLAALADGWTRRDYPAVAAHFTEDVFYTDPLRYAFHTRAQLHAFFANDDGQAQSVAWHLTLFDPERQVGMAEYTYEGTQRYHGVALIRLRDGLIARWFEYQHVDGRSRAAFAGEDAP